jgi:hypothetical protein
MTLLDVASVALFVILGFVESKRSAPTAAVDLGLALIGLSIAKRLAVAGILTTMSVGAGFALWFVLLMIVAGIAGWVFDNHTKWDIGPYDGPLAGILGTITGLVLAHGMFHTAVLMGGDAAAMMKASLLSGEIYNLNTLKAIGGMFGNLGSGPRIGDEVKDQMQ